MEKLSDIIKSDTIDWLLEENNPSVRYFALKELLGKEDNSSEVKEAKEKIMVEGIVPIILRKQYSGGHWGISENFYVSAKYKGTVWQIIILAELGADGNDTRIQNACEFILRISQDPTSGGFAYRCNNQGTGDHLKVLPCLTGNMLWSLIKFGYLDDPRVQSGLDWIIKYQRFDDGNEENPKDWPYNIGSKKGEACWGKHTCHMNVVKNLKALAEIPLEKRSRGVKKVIGEAVEFMLKHRIYKKSHAPFTVAKDEWTQFGFPLIWKVDALDVLGLITKLGYKDDRMQDAVDLVISKQNEHGRWILEKTFNGRMITNIEQKGKESKWITLHALNVLKRYYK